MNAMEYRSEQIPASGEIALTGANFFFLLTADAAVTVRFMGGGTDFGAASILAGVKIGRVVPWKRAVIRGAAGTAVTFFYGDAELREDVTDFSSVIATIGGIVSVAESPSTAIADTAPVNAVDAAQTALVPANLARRRVSFTVDSGAGGPLYLRAAGGANNLAELQSGIIYPFPTRAGLDVRNDTGADVLVYIFEES